MTHRVLIKHGPGAREVPLRRRFTLLFLGLLIAPGCTPPESEKLTAAECESITEEAACFARGCSFHQAWFHLFRNLECAAMEIRPICLATSDPIGNITQDLCRSGPDGLEMMTIGYAYGTVDGWERCPSSVDPDCRQYVPVCDAQADRASCEANYCYWVPAMHVATLEDGICTGWQPETVSRCLTPQSYIIYYGDASNFDVDPGTATFLVPPSTGQEKAFHALETGAAAEFKSGTAGTGQNWVRCTPEEEACSCPPPP